jgi:hypothetical protein
MRKDILLGTAFLIASGSALAADDYSQWAHARDLIVDASPAGAGITSDLAGFPLLMQWSPPESAELFSQAKPDGSDLRFSLPDGTHLAYQIETWEPSGSKAAVWVRLPLVKAGQIQRLRAHWGRSSAADSSDGSAVFRTGEGYQGVWHMQASLKDATANAIPAQDSGSTAEPAGRIGAGRRFANPDAYAAKGAYLSLGNPAPLNIAGALTLEAWVRWERRDGHRILICHGSAPGSVFETVLRIGETRDYRAGVWTGDSHYAALEAPAADSNAWVHLAGVYTGSGWVLYRNGTKAAATPADTNGAKPSPGAWRIGAEYANGVSRFFHGALDEVRISNTARSADWFKMEYANQKEGQTVAKWDPAVGVRPGLDARPKPKRSIISFAGSLLFHPAPGSKATTASGRVRMPDPAHP